METRQKINQQATLTAQAGQIFYIIGASGVGKDSLMQALCSLATKQDMLVIAPRWVTRATPQAAHDVEVTERDFRARHQSDAFLFSWQAHGFYYGIERNILAMLDVGHRILVNGSRAYVTRAREIYPELRVIGIEAAPQQLQARLKKRGRENGAGIAERLVRNEQYQDALIRADAVINNEQALDLAAAEFLSLLRAAN